MLALGNSGADEGRTWGKPRVLAPLADGRPAYERASGESAKAYAAFCLYRDIPPVTGSLPKVAKALGKSLKRVQEWSAARRWPW